MGVNNIVSGLRGPNDVRFPDGQHIRFALPSYKLGGTVTGERTIESVGSISFEDLTNNRKCVLIMTTYKKTGWISNQTSGKKCDLEGIIYDCKYKIQDNHEHIRTTFGKDIKFYEDLDKLKDIQKKICKVSGNWLTHLDIDKKRYWDVDQISPKRPLPSIESDVLPSDWRNREDLIWLKYQNMTIAAAWKHRLEVQQRHDRALRQAAEKIRK